MKQEREIDVSYEYQGKAVPREGRCSLTFLFGNLGDLIEFNSLVNCEIQNPECKRDHNLEIIGQIKEHHKLVPAKRRFMAGTIADQGERLHAVRVTRSNVI